MPDPSNPGFMQCEDCDHHFQVSPRGEVQVASCPDCGGKRLFRMQPNPVQSEGTLRNMVDMETGKDAGGNPDGEGILAPPSGRSILTAFGGTLCPRCGIDTLGLDICPRCGEPSGGPAELRPEIAGAPLTEGTIMDADHTDPLDTGTHGRDEYTHGHVAHMEIPCPSCGKSTSVFPNGAVSCNNYLCAKVWGPDGKEVDQRHAPATEPPGPVKAVTPHTGNDMDGVVFGETPAMKNEFLKWTPGMVGGGLVIADQPHTWNRWDPNQQGKDGLQLELGPGHQEYVKSLGIDPKHVDWQNAAHINPNGELPDEFSRKDLTPFIAADPRLKLVEEKTSSGPTMANHSRTNNMEPYETLWTPEKDMSLEPREAGLWGDIGAGALTAGGLALAIPTGGADLPEVAAGDAALLGGGEAGAGAADLASQGTKAAGGLMSKAMSGAGGLAKAEGISDLAGKGLQAGEGALGMGGGGGAAGGGGGEGYSGQLQQFTHVLAAFVESDYETPASNPDVGVKHDDPEDVDQKEFNDQDKSPENLLNPNLQDSGASGEDQVRDDAGKPSQGQFSSESPAIQRMDMLMPLIEKYYHSDESGANDPMLKQLHEELEAEVPGYLGQSDPELAERLMQHRKQRPEHVHAAAGPMAVREDTGDPIACPWCNGQDPNCEHCGGGGQVPERRSILRPDEKDRLPEIMRGQDRRSEPRDTPDRRQAIMCPACKRGEIVGPACNQCGTTVADILAKPTSREGQVKESIMPPMQQGNLNAQQQALDPTGLNPSMQPQAPSSGAPPGGTSQAGHCAKCGGVTQADGSCPQCGAPAMGQATALPGGPSQAIAPQTFAHTDLLASFVEGANHQGPVTPEQVAAVQQYLIQQGRVDEVPNVPLDPGNPEYAKILAEIQQNPTVPPTVTPEEQTQPPQAQPQAPGGMPVPGMAPGEAGGQPMQPMSSFLPELDFSTHLGADNIAPRCPKCHSGTTGLVGDPDNHAKCHACKNVWKLNDVLSDSDYGQSSISRVALRDERQHGGQGEQANPVGVPAADQSQQMNQGGDEDSSLTWQDTAGAPLKAGQTYQMTNPSYSLPDLVRVERVKPDGLDVTLLGTFANDPRQHDPNSLTSSTPISKQDADLQQLSFEPVNQTADDRNNEPPPGSAAPGYAQVPPSGQTTDEQSAQEPQMAVSHVEHDPDCPRCGHMEFTSSMISPEATEHNCFRCGHDWVTEERPDEHLGGLAQRENWTNPNADWLNEDEDAEDFLTPRRAGMARAAVQSRSLGDIAGKDERLRAVREHLTREGAERQERLAGKHFTPREQRELIDEDGFARNSDMLDLEGTHYKVRDDYESKTNPERVRDSDLFLGI